MHDASFMQQLNGGSQSAYCLMLCDTAMYEGKARTHLLDWGSSKIHRKMRSTLAAEASSAAKAYDRGAYARMMLHEIEYGPSHMWNRSSKDISSMSNNWRLMCSRIPFTLGTDCKSLYDLNELILLTLYIRLSTKLVPSCLVDRYYIQQHLKLHSGYNC